MKLTFSHEQCLDLGQILELEWLEPNGLGGYASSTLYDCHTRKYHGLLVASLAKPEGKFVLLSKVETELVIRGANFDFSLNKYPGLYHPSGHNYVESVEYGLYPVITFRLGDIRLRRSTMMPKGQNTVIIKLELLSASEEAFVKLRPLLAYRDYHTTASTNGSFRTQTRTIDRGFAIDPYEGMPTLYMDLSKKNTWFHDPNWYYNLEYQVEQRRGLDFQDDLLCPGRFEVAMKKGDCLYVRGSIDQPTRPAEEIWNEELARREAVHNSFADDDELLQMIKTKSEHLIVRNPRGELSIIAGYHWFAEWGRDAMIALPGLTLYCDRFDEALEILKTYAMHERGGLIPNYLANASDNHAYNSVDASLWFMLAAQQFDMVTGKRKVVKKELLPAITHILYAFADGKVADVRPCSNGLIAVGSEHTQLTWMDAEVNSKPVTPRHGLAVELNALWYNAICFYNELTDGTDSRFVTLAGKVQSAFSDVFWLPERQCLADVVHEWGPDLAIRPNQIFAASVPHSPLNDNQIRQVVSRVRNDLVTPYGLRTLSPEHHMYVSHYRGDANQRDSCYHQGTVWPWLMGAYVEASLRVATNKQMVARQLLDEFEPLFEQHPLEAALFTFSEIFDAEMPHDPKGTVSQAWSVAEVIRARHLIAEALKEDE